MDRASNRTRIRFMYSFAMLIVFSLNFLYLIRWANKEHWRSRTCTNFDLFRWKDSSNPPAKLLGFVSTLVLLFCAVNIIMWASWGITDNPYHQRGDHFIRAGDLLGMLVLGLAAFCTCSFGYLLFKFGQIQATREQREALMDPQEKARLIRMAADEALEKIERRRTQKIKTK
jgi:hypothetical protein